MRTTAARFHYPEPFTSAIASALPQGHAATAAITPLRAPIAGQEHALMIPITRHLGAAIKPIILIRAQKPATLQGTARIVYALM